ncbi:MAG: PAS domain S-box protein [Arenimonas sp.]|uniref:PAS domain S-box protein n=1 Tax=Arenimonas sp. TaxID=1872635 RepID=UPI0025C72B29|nr:PAS domain S-box protein [Arenimonas sp.]MBW8366892.1 PAS domain S-box protein [Arenimonas sp.]
MTLWSRLGIGLLLVTLLDALVIKPASPAPGPPAMLALASPLLIGAWLLVRGVSARRARFAPVIVALLAMVLLALVAWPAAQWLAQPAAAVGAAAATLGMGLATRTDSLARDAALRALGAAQLGLMLLVLASGGHVAGSDGLGLAASAMAAHGVLGVYWLGLRLGVGEQRILRLSTALLAGVGLVAMAGWASGSAAIVQGGTVYVPIQFNTALCCLLLAVVLGLLGTPAHRRSLWLLAPVVVLAGASLVEEYAGLAMDVGEWLISHHIVAEGVVPGRMAPNTATAFLIAALGIALAPIGSDPAHSRWGATWACGFMVSVIGAVALVGYVVDVPVVRAWGSHTPMALLTGIAMLGLGLALAYSGGGQGPGQQRRASWLPLAVGMAVTLTSLWVWSGVSRDQEQRAQQSLARQMDVVEKVLIEGVHSRISSLDRAAARMAQAPDQATRQFYFRLDAQLLVRDFPSLAALVLTDPDGVALQVESRLPNATDLLGRHVDTDNALVRIFRVEGPAAGGTSSPTGASTAERGVLIVRPGLGADGETVGFLAAAIEYQPLFALVLSAAEPANDLALSRGQQRVFHRGNAAGTPALVREISLLGAPLRIELWPVPASPGAGNFAGLLLFTGLATGFLLALSLRLAVMARDRAILAESNGRALGEQIVQRERERLALADVERELASVFESISDGFYTLSHDWRFMLVNPRAEQLLNRQRGELAGHCVWDAFPEALGSEIEVQFRKAAAERCPVAFEIEFAPLGSWFSARAFPHANGLAVYFRDISERKRADLALARAQASASRALRLAHLGAWEYDLATGEPHWSQEVLQMFGLTAQDAARGPQALLDRVEFDDRARVREAYRSLRAGEGDIDIEYRILRHDGDRRAVREIGTLVRDDQGQPKFAAGAMQDITEGKRAEDALRELTRRLEQSLVLNRLVMDNSLDVICAIDANGRFSQVSAASAAVWGYPAKELLGRPVADLVHPDDRAATAQAMADVLSGRSTLDFRNRHVTPDGRVVIMQWSLVWSARERLVFAVARDATEAERQSKALREARDSLQRAQQVARMGAWQLDLPSHHLTLSAEVHDIFQVEESELGGNFEAFAARAHPDDIPALVLAQEAVLAGGPDLDLEHRIMRPDGSIGYVHERARLVRDESGTPRLLAGSVQDVTERNRQERRLRESEQRMRTTVESALDSIITMDEQGSIIEFNASAERTFGHRREDVLGRRLSDIIIPPELRAGHEQGMLRYLATGEARVLGKRLELPAIRADGELIQVELSTTEIKSEQGRAFTAFIRDITQAKLARRLEARQRSVLAGIASRRPLPETLTAIARLFELQYPGALCSVLLLDQDGERVLTGAAPSLPETFTLGVHGQRIGPRAGSCGTAAWRGERVVVTDIEADPLWEDYLPLARAHGLRACWSTPVLSVEGKVLATFATYYRQPHSPSEAELGVVDSLVALVAMAVEQVADFQRIQLSEQRFRSLFDEHPDAVYAMDLEGRYTAYNGRLKATGRTIDQVRGEMFDANVAPEQREVVRAHFNAAVQGQARTYEATAVLEGGLRMDMRVTNLPILVDGQVTGVFGIAQDISLLRKHQRELAEALNAAEAGSLQLRRLSDSAIVLNRNIGEGDIYPLLAELARDILGANQAVVSVGLGGADHHIHAVSLSDKYAQWRDYAAPADNSGIYALVSQTNQPMRLTQAELEAHPRWRGFGAQAKHHPPMRGWLAVPLMDSAGRNMGLLQLSDKVHGEFTPDDELVAMQFAQMASIAIERARLIQRLSVRDRFFELSAEIFVIYSPEKRRWLQVNPVFCQITGYTAEEMCSRDFTDFIHADDHAATLERSVRQQAGVNVPHHFENRYLSKRGDVRWIAWTSVPGDDGLVYGVGRDITERRRAELVLRQTLADLNNRNRELQDFAFIASHDLQEPLRKIRAFSDRLQQRYAASLVPEARDYLDRAGQAAARMQTLIDDLLAYSRVTRGKPFAPVDLEQVLSGVMGDLEARLDSSGGRIEASPLPTIEGDPSQLRQLLQNLLSNALKFRSAERAPVVTVRACETILDGAPAWELRFEDNGIGFEAKYAERIFGPFQRLHGRQDYEGTGIGLAIVRRIVERHRGQIRAEGRPGHGATFILVLPARQPVEPSDGAQGAIGLL